MELELPVDAGLGAGFTVFGVLPGFYNVMFGTDPTRVRGAPSSS